MKKSNRVNNQVSNKKVWYCGCDRGLVGDTGRCGACGAKAKKAGKTKKDMAFNEEVEFYDLSI